MDAEMQDDLEDELEDELEFATFQFYGHNGDLLTVRV